VVSRRVFRERLRPGERLGLALMCVGIVLVCLQYA
jgi:multidrug transporter EmrE-like cation transporter